MDLLFYPRLNDATNTAGRCSLYCKITVNKLSCVPFSTDIRIYAKNWQPKKKTTNDEFSDTVRQEINRLENILRRIKIDLEERHEPITAEIIKYNYLKLKKDQRQTKPSITSNSTTLESLYSAFTEKKMKEGAKKSTKRHDYYLAKSFLDFATKKGFKDIKPSNVTLELVEQFCDNFNNSKNYLRQSVKLLIRVLDIAVKKKIIMHNPAKEVELPKGGSTKKNNEIGLEPEELEILKNAKTYTEREEKAIDIFLFMCGTSLDFCDYNILTENDIVTIGTTKIVRAERQKTDRYDTERICQHNAIIKEVALEVLGKYGSIENLPRFKYSHDLDAILREIAERNGIEKNSNHQTSKKNICKLIN
ncbi:tyrosine recombinase [Emticicia aquatilis]|uniref:Tyrosine recombinase n=1 Tax=Emticicia aquatilis TaxID=1537369 RepID=A0A916YPH5_9BACT|nr:phage integrase SAM-like domain-containing protein [Emticicia aquatilis]GGD53131.1 tyrosine recombinase [Emticicia aquatilis]